MTRLVQRLTANAKGNTSSISSSRPMSLSPGARGVGVANFRPLVSINFQILPLQIRTSLNISSRTKLGNPFLENQVSAFSTYTVKGLPVLIKRTKFCQIWLLRKMGMKRIVRSKEEGEERWNWITGFIHRKDDEFPKIMSRKISKKRQETRNYDKDRNSMILEFQKFGFSSRRGVQAWVEKEIEELAQRMNENSITVNRASPTRTDISRNRKPSAKNKSSQLKLNASPVDVPLHIRNAIQEIGGTAPVWLGAKVLTHSDINAQLGRFLFPRCCDAGVYKTMTSDEKENVEVVDQVGGLDAKLIDPKGEVWDVEFKHWKSLNGFVFTGKNWNRLVKENSWSVKTDVIHIWIFRSSPIAQISFAIYTTPRMNICN